MKINLSADSVMIIKEIMRVSGHDDPSFVVDRALIMSAVIAGMPTEEQIQITNLLFKYENEPTKH